MWAVPKWLHEAVLRTVYRRENASMSPSKEAAPSCPVSAWSAKKTSARKRQHRVSVKAVREHSDYRQKKKKKKKRRKKKKRQEKRLAKSCCSHSSAGREGDEAKVNDSYQLERHCRLAFGPALGTRSMAHWRATKGIVNWAENHNMRHQPYNRSPSKASAKHPEPKPKLILKDVGPKELTETGRFETLYSMGELIGHGGYGSVYAGHRKSDNLPVALKMVDMNRIKMWAKMSEFEEPIPLEIALLRQVCRSHPCQGIAQLLDYMELQESYVMVLERPEPCQDLFTYMQEGQGYLEEAMAKHMLQQLVRVLLHCHSRGVVHRDLKPENILVETATQRLKLLDFGSASVIKEGHYTDVAGTPEYFPPETVLRGEYFAVPATVWSLGILLFQMVWGDVPFYDEAAIVKGILYFPRGISRECRHLIRQCLTVSPKDRPTLEQILLHPWML